jgi:hypothetical protein
MLAIEGSTYKNIVHKQGIVKVLFTTCCARKTQQDEGRGRAASISAVAVVTTEKPRSVMSAPTVIRASDLQSMTRRALVGAGSQVLSSDLNATSRRKAASAQRSAKWGNTLVAQRRSKQQAKIDRHDAKECAAQALDAKEEGIRNQQQVDQLRAAREAILSQTAHRKMLAQEEQKVITKEVLSKQSAMRRRRAEMEAAAEAGYVDDMRRRIARAEEAEAASKATALAHKLQVAADLREQVHQAKEARIAELQEAAAEGAAVQAAIAAHEAELLQTEIKSKEAGRKRNKEQQRANADLVRSHAAAKDLERLQDEALAAAAVEKERLDTKRADFMEMKRREAAQRAEFIGKVVAEQFASQMGDEAARLDRQRAAASAKTAAVQEAKQSQSDDLQAAIDKSRQQQMARKAAAKRLDAQQRAAQAAAWQAKVDSLEAGDCAVRDERRRAARRNAEYQKAQMLQKQMAFARAEGRSRGAESEAATTNLAGDDGMEAAKEALLSNARGRNHNTVGMARQFQRSTRDPLVAADAYM